MGLKILVVKPGKRPEVATIDGSLESMQKVVGGYIEEIIIEKDIVLICNEEGRLSGLQPNRLVGGNMIVGTFFLANDNRFGENYGSLTDEQINRMMKRFG
ncbi:DUF3846 domain-containing protein [Anaerorhabdus sp.]|uniref:DUF3846 domain-containing protein n=1 Tax=Anaerorhabdus sp. TaxID=1872524 RepID=UPI002FCB76A0